MSRKIFVTENLAAALVQYHEQFGESAICEDGKEYPSDKKLFVHSENRPLSMKEQIQRLLRDEFDKQMDAQNFETREDANDFDIDDDAEELKSPYEINDMVEEYLQKPFPAEAEEVLQEELDTMKAEPEPSDQAVNEP